MTAGGSDIYSTADHFEFAYVPITGNVTLTARVVSLVNTNTNAKAGVMIRNSLDSGSPEASALVTYSNGINLDYRTTLNGSSSETKISSLAAPYWVRIVRSGSSFSAYRSSDGSTWTQIGTTKTISMNSTVLVGLAVTSHSDGTATTAVFDNITITGTADVAPTVSTAAAASPTTVTGTTASLSALGADSDGGGESYLTYTWTAVRDSSTPASVTFSANGTNAAKSTTVTFTKAGTYKFKVTIKDTGGLSVTSSVSITVNQTFTSIVLRPATLRISPLGVKQFSAAALDQFGLPMSTQPSFTWSIASGGGSIVSSGATATYTAPLTGASATVRATSGSIYGSTTVTIVNQSPLLAASLYPYAADSVAGRSTALGVLGVDDAGESNLTYTWSVIGTPPAAVIFDVNGSNAAKNTTITFTKAGMYNLRATITDAGGLVATTSLSVEVFSAVAGREIFYNNSKFDSASDANAIATDKQALLPGRTATFANYTSYSLGINGIMVDITGLANATALTAADFQFKVGNDDDPDGWTDAPAPISITVRQGEGTNSSDRVIIIWADGAIKNQWLQVTVLATDNTGLAAADVFYFGNAVGESGDNSANAVVDAQDEINSRANKTGFSAAAITNFYDYNRDGKVNATDDLIARHNRTDGVGADPLQLIAAPVGAPPASYNTLQPMSSGNDPGNLITFLASQTFIHSGGLLTQADFDRMITKVNANAQPWKSGWDELLANSHSSPNYVMQGPVSVVYRGTGYSQNYSKLYNDIAAAYQNALRWKIAGDTACANKAVAICDAWSATLTSIQGTSDKYLAAGLYGYEFAIVAEIMRSYNGWGESANFNRFKNMMTNIFYPMNHAFLVNHNGAAIDHYWCNWDVCNMASIIAIGILCDDTAKYNEAINYFKYGAGNGAIDHGVYYVHPGNLGQSQESGRDQGHATLDISLYGAFCQMAYNQGDDLFAYENNKILALCEYTAKYNLFYDVPYVPYNNSDNVNQTVISSAGRGSIRPSWELIYNHYVNLKGIPAPYTEQFAALVRPEGGGGDYGPNSGGYDQLGFGTLTFTLDPYTPPASVAGRYIFYNNSKFDATADSAAIATDKAALLPGQTATFGNYTSYSLGINGIMVDIKGLANPGALAASDFQFQVGNGGSWAAAPAPLSVGVSQGTGTDGSDRITIAWSDNAIQDKWLQVTVKANTNTGLAAADVFYFGNAVGESGDNSANAVVDAQDEINSRANKTGFSAAAITNFYDYNRDGKVNATDDLIARHNRTDGVGADPLQLIAAPASGDALQPLSAAADIEEISQLVTLSEDNTTSQPATLSAEIATSQSEILPTAAGNSNLFSTIYNAEASNNSVPTLERGNQNSTLERGNQNSTLERGNQNSTPERGNQNSTLERGSQISAAGSAVRDSSLTISLEGRQLLSISLGPAAPLQLMTLRPTTAEGFASSFPRRSYESHGYSGLAQDRLHDAVFARSIAILSLTAENVLPEDSSAPADIETILNDRLSLKSDKSLSRAIDAVLAATRHKQE
jgi:plastocyanin